MDGHYIDNGAPLSGGGTGLVRGGGGGGTPLVRETDSMRIPLSQPEDAYSLNEVGYNWVWIFNHLAKTLCKIEILILINKNTNAFGHLVENLNLV